MCTDADGHLVPIVLIGKYNNPVCFELLWGEPTTLPYKDQSNAWLWKAITFWWVKNLFCPHHMTRNGEVNAILILENWSSHHVDKSKLPQKLFIKFLPSSVTSRYQPTNMVMISRLKISYKYSILQNLLDIFDSKVRFEYASQLRACQKIDKKGIAYGFKPQLLECMNM